MVVRPRSGVDAIPAYRAGRTPGDLASRGVVDPTRLASNEAPYGLLPAVRAVLERESASVNRYPSVRAADLRAALAGRLGVDASSVTVGPGSAGLLWQLGQAFLDDGDRVVVPWPSFEAYPQVATLMRAELDRVPLAGGTADPAAIAARIDERTKMVVLAEPNNPTGTLVGEAGVAALVAATAGRCLLVLDEAYVEFVRRADAADAVGLARAHDHVVVLRTFSKAHGLAGLRVGYAIGSPAVVDYLDRVAPPFSVSSAAQAAAIASIGATDELAARVDAVVGERERVTAELRSAGWPVEDSSANFVWLAAGRWAEPLAAALEDDAVITRAIRDEGLRVTIGARADNDRFLAALGPAARRIGLAPDAAAAG